MTDATASPLPGPALSLIEFPADGYLVAPIPTSLSTSPFWSVV